MLVFYYDEVQDREFVFLTNATHISSLVVAELYKNRWQIELFFKWLKQHLKIKKFGGTNVCGYFYVDVITLIDIRKGF